MFEKFSFKGAKQKNKRDNDLNKDTAKSELHIPRHIAIIMDGNGRWAKERGLPRVAGHREGMKVVKKIVREASRLGVEVLTMYAFSTENWKRPKDEVEFLLKLPEQFLTTYLKELIDNNVQVRIMGDTKQLPPHTLRAVNIAKERTKDNDGMILNFALNYGSRYEMTMALKNISEDILAGHLNVNDITEDVISNYLLTSALPDPDLLIRTSGEIRLSNFMLWQLAYTELWFTNVYWPDFNEEHLHEAIAHFSRRTRRYGGV
ncbi:undecaprenyl diphosphate synthase [Scopulibacillus daqui]|uniref:Isoprenyl transferase n=1 Tax=Scopulibacillus daqui TaxID=1469162 RepID=A0ABS2PWN8_9BACL|nr:isoprenyl transferase [Scopulibacillus daqui]MBM7644378.1 undecaprenyl diphosphate synthase [Scopulibacillus daqui]